ncbi:hypothetical protein [Erwinia rhapontici]|uniref:hypothetical protein n=1 Tax=Erwinia rhapontici TaxID=55212 RepID=UPI001414ED7A|nr:hypothetical protein [Erwinia rhapontici]
MKINLGHRALLLLAGRQLFTGLAQGGDHFLLLRLWPGFLLGQYQVSLHHPAE